MSAPVDNTRENSSIVQSGLESVPKKGKVVSAAEAYETSTIQKHSVYHEEHDSDDDEEELNPFEKVGTEFSSSTRTNKIFGVSKAPTKSNLNNKPTQNQNLQPAKNLGQDHNSSSHYSISHSPSPLPPQSHLTFRSNEPSILKSNNQDPNNNEESSNPFQQLKLNRQPSTDPLDGSHDQLQIDSVNPNDHHDNDNGMKRRSLREKFSFGMSREVKHVTCALSLVLILILIIFLLSDLATKGGAWTAFENNKSKAAYIVGAVFTFFAILLTGLHIREHLRHYVHHASQKNVIRILVMVPVYALSSYFSLVCDPLSLYLDFIVGCYEAYVVYCFLMLLTKYMGGHASVVLFLANVPSTPWPVPLNHLFKPIEKPDTVFLFRLKRCTLQYAIIQPLLSFIAIVLHFSSLYGDGEISLSKGYVYCAFIRNASQMVALYTLVWLYTLIKDELKAFKPMHKFLAIKLVIFFTFWQSILLSILVAANVITASDTFDATQIQTGLQDFIICIEMFIASVAHRYVFDVESYVDNTIPNQIQAIMNKNTKINLHDDDL